MSCPDDMQSSMFSIASCTSISSVAMVEQCKSRVTLLCGNPWIFHQHHISWSTSYWDELQSSMSSGDCRAVVGLGCRLTQLCAKPQVLVMPHNTQHRRTDVTAVMIVTEGARVVDIGGTVASDAAGGPRDD